MAFEIRRCGKNIVPRRENTGGESEALEILSNTDVPVDIVFEDEGCGEVLFNYPDLASAYITRAPSFLEGEHTFVEHSCAFSSSLEYLSEA